MPSDIPNSLGNRPAWLQAMWQSSARTKPEQSKRRIGRYFLYGAFALQAVCAFFFVGELWSEILGLRKTPIPYAWQEFIQVFASFGIMAGVIATGIFVRHGMDHVKHLDRQIDVASGNYQEHLISIFDGWALSPSERSVAIYAMKGFSNAEIAELRKTSPATIKSQTNAIYRKSGLGNRPQLIAFLVEELLAGIEL